jgi:hypothetical protein
MKASTKKSNKTARSKTKHSPRASKSVSAAMNERTRGQLQAGRSRAIAADPQQAIAVDLAEARRQGAKVPRRAARTAKTSKSRGTRRRG